MRKLSILLLFITIGLTSCSQEKSTDSNEVMVDFMNGRKNHNVYEILRFFGKTDSSGIAVSSFFLQKDEIYKIQKVEIIGKDNHLKVEGDVAYTIRMSKNNLKPFQDFWFLLRKVNGKWICVSHSALGVDDDDEFYK